MICLIDKTDTLQLIHTHYFRCYVFDVYFFLLYCDLMEIRSLNSGSNETYFRGILLV